MKTYKVTWTVKKNNVQTDCELHIDAENAQAARAEFDRWYAAKNRPEHPFHIKVRLCREERKALPVYDNADRKCECIRCEKVTTCPYQGKYQRLSKYDAPSALGLCPKLPEGYRGRFA